MSERALRRRCRNLLRQLDARPPLDIPEMCAQLGILRGRPIYLRAHPLPASGPFGVWLSLSAADYIFYQEHTSQPHQEHIILHELGHLIAEHRSDGRAPALLPQADRMSRRARPHQLSPGP